MKEKIFRIIKYAAAAIYAACMLILLFGRPTAYFSSLSYVEHLRHSTNIVPFSTIAEYFGYLLEGGYMVRQAVINLGGNVIMFIPLGFFLALLWKKLRRFVPHLVTTAAIITSVELIQLFTLRGSADIDDLLLNVIGSALGYLVYLIASAICKRLRHSA